MNDAVAADDASAPTTARGLLRAAHDRIRALERELSARLGEIASLQGALAAETRRRLAADERLARYTAQHGGAVRAVGGLRGGAETRRAWVTPPPAPIHSPFPSLLVAFACAVARARAPACRHSGPASGPRPAERALLGHVAVRRGRPPAPRLPRAAAAPALAAAALAAAAAAPRAWHSKRPRRRLACRSAMRRKPRSCCAARKRRRRPGCSSSGRTCCGTSCRSRR